MRKTFLLISLLILSVGVLLAFTDSVQTRAADLLPLQADTVVVQDNFTGEWTGHIESDDKGERFHVNLYSERKEKKHHMQMSFEIPLQELSGLSQGTAGDARFSLVREAGTMVFDGLFRNGRGVGDYRFTPNADYVRTLRNQGYDEVPSAKMMSLMVFNVSTKFIQEMKSLGYDRLPLEKLISFRIFRVDGEFIRALGSLGYDSVSADKLISMKIHKADEEFIRQMQAAGYKGTSVDKLVSFRIHGVNPEFIREMKELGYGDLPADKLVSFRIHRVDGKFVKDLRDQGYDKLSADELIRLKIFGVDGEYIKRMKGSK